MKSLFFILLFPIGLFANTLRLINDSTYVLRAQISASDGSFLGEIVLNPETTGTWSTSYDELGVYSGGDLYHEGLVQAQAPYTVLWFCPDGGEYAYCNEVSPGATVTAQSCLGTQICKK